MVGNGFCIHCLVVSRTRRIWLTLVAQQPAAEKVGNLDNILDATPHLQALMDIGFAKLVQTGLR